MQTERNPEPERMTREAPVPCGHEADVLRLHATDYALLYCHRCERGFDVPVAIA